MNRWVFWAVVVVILVGVPAYFVAGVIQGIARTERNSDAHPPAWAKVAPEQIAEAKKHGVPVAFENDLGMRFVLIPAGTFLMGSPEDEKGRGDDEAQHKVTITKPYYMQITEVTNGQYRRFRADHDSGSLDVDSLDGDLQPVGSLAWSDAAAFAEWIGSQDEGRAYRHPSEAEWEYACRAGTMTRFSFGDPEQDEFVLHGRFFDRNSPFESAPGSLGARRAVAARVGTYPPNRWGLHDMHGNVREHVSDFYARYA